MKILINIALQSLLSRKVTVFLTIISLTISIVLFLSIDTLRLGAKKNLFRQCKIWRFNTRSKIWRDTVITILFISNWQSY